jgi:hypothetical protein
LVIAQQRLYLEGMMPVKYCEIVADKLFAARLTWAIAALSRATAGAGLLMRTKTTANAYRRS